MPMIPVYQFLSLKLGFSGSILIGIFLTLSGILLGTTELGGNILVFITFCLADKTYFCLYKSWSYKSCYFDVFSIISNHTVLFIGVFNIWYNRWDGINKMEE